MASADVAMPTPAPQPAPAADQQAPACYEQQQQQPVPVAYNMQQEGAGQTQPMMMQYAYAQQQAPPQPGAAYGYAQQPAINYAPPQLVLPYGQPQPCYPSPAMPSPAVHMQVMQCRGVAGEAVSPLPASPAGGFLEPGILRVTLKYAHNLKDCDWIKKQDPYVRVRCGQQSSRTQTHKGAGTCPVWNETLQFQVLNENQIVVEIWDEDRFSADDIIGTATLDLASVRQRGVDQVQAPVFCKADNLNQGSVAVQLEFQSLRGMAAGQQASA